MSIEARLRETLNRRAHEAGLPQRTWESVRVELQRHRRRRVAGRFLGATATLMILAGGLAWLWEGFAPLQPREGGLPPETPMDVSVDPRVGETIRVGEFPQNIAVGEGAVWVTVDDFTGMSEGYSLLRIDPVTNEISGSLEIGESADVAVGAESVWLTGARGHQAVLQRVEPDSMRISQEIPLGDLRLNEIDVGAGGVWLTSTVGEDGSKSELVKVDPNLGQVVQRVPMPGDARDLVTTDNAAWVEVVTYRGHAVHIATLYRVPAHGEDPPAPIVEAPALSGSATPTVVAAGYGSIWTMVGRTTQVARIDVDTGALQAEPFTIDRPFLAFATGVGGVWFRGGPTGEDFPSVISRLDPVELEVDTSIPLDTLVIDAALDADGGTIWIANYEDTVQRIDLRPS
jgi:hypothetical protein